MNCDVKLIFRCLELLTDAKLCSEHEELDNLKCKLIYQISSVLEEIKNNRSLEQRIQLVCPRFLQISETDHLSKIIWIFVEWCLVLLAVLNESFVLISHNEETCQTSQSKSKSYDDIAAPPLSNDVLSVLQQKTIGAVVQFIVALGINPGLIPGVGIPIQKRTQFGIFVQELNLSILPEQKYHRLVLCTLVLLNCLCTPSLKTVILSNHLIDLLSALFQLCYAPIKKICSETKSSELQELKSPNDIGNHFESNTYLKKRMSSVCECFERIRDESYQSEQQLIKEMWQDRSFFIAELECLLKRLHKPLLIQTLFQLQGLSKYRSGKSSSLTPRWLRNSCAMVLTQELLQPTGVLHIIQGLLDPVQDIGSDPVKWKKVEAISKTIAQVPSCCSSAESYYQIICPQVLKLLYIKSNEQNKTFHHIKLSIISSMSEFQPILTTKYILEPLLKPMMICIKKTDTQADVCQEVLASEEELNICVENIYKIVVYGSNISQNVLSQLYKAFIPLCHLLYFTAEGIFYLSVLFKNNGPVRHCHTQFLRGKGDKMCEIIPFNLPPKTRKSSLFLSADGLQKLEDVIVFLLKLSNEPVLLLNAALFNDWFPQGVFPMNPNCSFTYGENGGIKIFRQQSVRWQHLMSCLDMHIRVHAGNVMCQRIKIAAECVRKASSFVCQIMCIFKSAKAWELENRQKCFCLLQILHKIEDKNLIQQMFFSFLQKLQEMLGDFEDKNEKKNDSENLLIYIETNHDLQLKRLFRNLLLLQLLQEIIDNFGNDIVEDNNQAITFIHSTLDRCIYLHRKGSSPLELETLAMALSALAMLLNQKNKLKHNDWIELKKCIPSLQELIRLYSNTDIEITAQELMTIIATCGAATWHNEPKSKGVSNDIKKMQTNKNSTIRNENDLNSTKQSELFHNKSEEFKQQTNASTLCPGQSSELSAYQTAWKELHDVLLPVRGHALIAFKKLIKKKDPETMQNLDKLFEKFVECIADTDSYIYLSSIQCLTALGTVKSEKVIRILTLEFLKLDQTKDVKMKLGESLMQISRQLVMAHILRYCHILPTDKNVEFSLLPSLQCGDLAPKYQDILVPAFLSGTKHADSDIRASSMSNLGEICQKLKYSLGSYLQEIIVCVTSLVRTDPSVDVKRSAILMLSLLLRGLGSNSFKILETELCDLYHLLKLVYSNEKDDIIRLHAEIALEELKIIVRDSLHPDQNLIKEIRILQPF